MVPFDRLRAEAVCWMVWPARRRDSIWGRAEGGFRCLHYFVRIESHLLWCPDGFETHEQTRTHLRFHERDRIRHRDGTCAGGGTGGHQWPDGSFRVAGLV